MRIVEIGVGNCNGSTRAFSEGLRHSLHQPTTHILVDIRPEAESLAPDGVHFVQGDSTSALTVSIVRYLLEGYVPDIIFIDTEHTYEQMQAELAVWSAIACSCCTTWLFHDTWMWGHYNHMTDAIKEFCEARPEWVYEDITRESHGLGRMRPAKS